MLERRAMKTLLGTLGCLCLASWNPNPALAAASNTTVRPRLIIKGNTVVPPSEDSLNLVPGANLPGKQMGGARTAKPSSVKLTEEAMVIPTYELGAPEPNPIFYTQESYQGAQKRVYPYPLLDNLTHGRTNRSYKALKLENNFIQITVLPDLGGRLFEAVDKSNGYDFFYRQHVIKPALIGMLGAWISGGIEWCVFHHHRNTTFMPVDYMVADNPDGSKTIWFGEIERRHRMKWVIGLTLYPDKSYVEATVKFFNRTPLPHSILYWANVAVHVNDDYQVIFPPSVQAATYHSKIDFTQWPLSQVKYRGVDYKGIDLSWWGHNPEANSFFAWQLQEDFMGGYDHGKQAGVVHVANHHVVGGAKLWEWGTGPAGRRWDKILTDEDGPYAELMVGAFSDNQPDYSWIKPYEVKTFKQYWFPVSNLGGFKNANLNGAVNLELRTNGVAVFGFNTTARFAKAKAQLKAGERVLTEAVIDIGPGRTYRKEVQVPEGTKETDLRVALVAADGKELLAYQPITRKPVTELPKTVKAPLAPKDISSIEELYLTGVRIEQIHNPTVDPTQYYQEVLNRDPGESRANTALGLNCLKRGRYTEAERYFKSALERLTIDYTRSANAEANFYLGLALRAQGKHEAAYEQFARASWDSAFRTAGSYQMAELSCRKGDYAQALEQVNDALATGAQNNKARALRAALLRKLGHFQDAATTAAQALRTDPLDFLAMNEQHLANAARGLDVQAKQERANQHKKMRDDVQAYLELGADYLNWGLYDEGIMVLRRPIEFKMDFAGTYPLVYYYLGYLYELKGEATKGSEYYGQGSRMPADYCFPFRQETLAVLHAALQASPEDARAFYYLGNLLYEWQPDKALECWEKARSLMTDFAPVLRNLGWVYFRVKNNLTNALECYEQAIAARTNDPRLYFELDSLYELANVAPERRLKMFEQHHDIARQRVESFTREIAVLVLAGRYGPAIDHLATNAFHVREGSGEIHDIYVDAHLLEGLRRLKANDAAGALKQFEQAAEYPDNLSVGRPRNDRRAAQVGYYLGTAYEAAGNQAKAEEAYRKAAAQADTDYWTEAQYYQALCWRKLGDKAKADKMLDKLAERGANNLKQGEGADFFAKFGEQETRQARKAGAHFTLGLAAYGKDQRDQARQEFEQAVNLNRSNPWARQFLAELQ
jgi:tetratricopeptide (TPR) repeat protein